MRERIRAATYVDKILKGAKPADLSVEQPTKFELIINLKAAKQIGLTIPPNVLARADKVITMTMGIVEVASLAARISPEPTATRTSTSRRTSSIASARRRSGFPSQDRHSMTNGGDPVESGLVASLARPGGNITGLATLRPELSGKRLELLKEVVPRLSRVAVFASPGSGDYAQILKELDLAAGPLGVKLQHLDIRSSKDFETAFQAATKGRADAVLIQLPGPILTPHRKDVTDLAVKSRLPLMYDGTEVVEVGGLMSYSVSSTDRYRRAATYVVKILKGAKPADLPVEQPTRFELVINLKTAKQIGLTIPPNVLARADRVIR